MRAIFLTHMLCFVKKLVTTQMKQFSFTTDQGICIGDSGGPLMLEQNRKGRKNHTLVGIVSWGISNCVKNVPGVYADVSFFLEWILNKID